MLRGLLLAGIISSPLAAQDSAEDAVIGSCMRMGNAPNVCICASLVLHARLGDEEYARYGEIEEKLAAINSGDAGGEAEDEAALLAEGYRYFVPHGQAMKACAAKIAAGE